MIRITSLIIAAALTSCAGPMQNGSYPSYSYANSGNRYSEGPSSYSGYGTSPASYATNSANANSSDSSSDADESSAIALGLMALFVGAAIVGSMGGDYESSSSSSEDDRQMRQHAARQQANRHAYNNGQLEPFPDEGR